VHYEPVITTIEFGRCGLYKDTDGKVGYAAGARFDQTKCGDGGAWFSPKKRKAVYIPYEEDPIK